SVACWRSHRSRLRPRAVSAARSWPAHRASSASMCSTPAPSSTKGKVAFGWMSDDCLFCRILVGEIASAEVLSTDTNYAFRDISPQAPTHVLVIPRQHIDNAHAVPREHADVVGHHITAA